MIKKLILTLLLFLFLSSPGYSYTLEIGEPGEMDGVVEEVKDQINIVYDGILQNIEPEPVRKDDYIMVPLRPLFEMLGAEVYYRNKVITARKDHYYDMVTGEGYRHRLSFIVGDKYAMINGQTYDMKPTPYLEDDRIMVPLRFAAEALGCGVEWNDKLKYVNIIPGE